MRFIIGEDIWSRFARYAYRGVIGIFYESTLGGVLAYLFLAIVTVMTIVGIITTVRWLMKRAKQKERKKW